MKPGAFTQMYIQLVFAVWNRENSLKREIRPRVYEYVSGILTSLGHKTIAINGITDHVHIFFGLNPSKSVSDTVHDIKRGSSLFINQNKLVNGHFSWQEGYGAFTYSRSQIKNVFKYIQTQETHHAKRNFRDEYLEFLEKYAVDYDPRYLFEFYD